VILGALGYVLAGHAYFSSHFVKDVHVASLLLGIEELAANAGQCRAL
jgi:hypothetical protein